MELEYRIASKADIDRCVRLRLEMLRVVNGLPEDHAFSAAFVEASRDYFVQGAQTTVLAVNDAGEDVGCATLCCIGLMPTFDHPTGRRAHLMNVYTRAAYRRQGVARRMVERLLEEAKRQGVTEVSLDTTAAGRPLYEACGFAPSEEGMVLVLK